MRVSVLAVLLAGSALALSGQSLTDVLNFGAPQSGRCPAGWSCNPPETITLDQQTVHSGKWAVRIQRAPDSPAEFSGISDNLPLEFAGKTVELRGFIRSQDGFAAFWMREDTESEPGDFISMQAKSPVKGTTPWTEYSISLPVNAQANRLVFGFLQVGAGQSWADDLQLLVDGKPLSEAPKQLAKQTVLDTDHEFDQGSRISLGELTPVQISNLVTVCKVWGFVKYHHPAVTSGQRHFGYDLLRILPAVLAAPDRNTANTEMFDWIRKLGSIQPCSQCARLSQIQLYLSPPLDWLHDEDVLGPSLSGNYRRSTAIAPLELRNSTFRWSATSVTRRSRANSPI